MFSRRRKLLEIHTVNDFANRKSLNFSTSAIMLCFVSFLFIIINMMTVPFQIIAKPLDMASYDAVYVYMKEAVISGIVCFILCGSICFYIFHSFSKRIATNLHRVQDIAKEGNLTSRIELTMLDDYGALSGAINELIEKLASMINALKNDTDVVAEQSDTLSAVSEEANSALKQMITSFKKIEEGSINQNTLVDNAEKDVLALTEDAEHVKKQVIAQTSSVETASAAINEMSANIASVAEMTRKADTVSSALSQSSAEGNASLKGAVAAITEIQKVSTEVEAIVKVIQAIASQTNLLSMNAAIEAAHAGEFGAGFAVVADEVRSLAQSSSNSAKDIQEKIKDMVGKINAGVDSINVAGKSFKDIEENVQATSELVKTIAAAMEEQRQGAEDTLRTTNELVNAIQSIKTLAESESERAENVRTVMLDVVSSSKNALEMVNEGVEASNHLNDAIEQVNDSVNSNRSAVSSMQGTVKGFRV